MTDLALEWWVCVWCDARFPYTDGPETLKAHSATCQGHPAVQVVAEVERWLADFYGPLHFNREAMNVSVGSIEAYEPGRTYRSMVQLDNGSEEYERRMDVAMAVAAYREKT